MSKLKKCAILVGGGPAPGINSVIRAATIKLRNEGVEVIGILEGFQHLMKGDTSRVRPLDIDDVSKIHFAGGSILRTSRANPTKKKEDLERVIAGLKKLKIDALITIGGDDTCFSSVQLEKSAKGRIQFVHVPKTIDNDLDLPYSVRTFGFATARHYGSEITRNLMVDAQTTGRWYLITAMGRKAGHLALGIGKSSGATITIIPEEFPEEEISLQHITDILIGSVIKRFASNRDYGVAVLAEGLAERLSPYELKKMGKIDLDPHGHIRLSEIDLGGMLKDELRDGLEDLGVSITVVDKDIGYELRSVEPTPFDIEYTKELGYTAAVFLLEGNSGSMATVQDGHFVPLPYDQVIDPVTGKTRIRLVDVNTMSYRIATEYMIRLKERDFTDSATLKKLAAVTNLTAAEFKKRFGYMVGL